MDILKKIAIAAPLTAAVLSGCGSDEPEVPGSGDTPATPDAPVVAAVDSRVIYEANPAFWGTQECLRKLQDDLPRIADMGCDILWLMPIYERGELKAIGSPYCIRDYKKVDSAYGTEDDVKSLVDAAHEKGMKVILDWVANHTAWDNVWISSHPEYYAKDASGNIAATASWGDVAQLDYSNASTRAAMKDAMTYWVDRCGVDGFRCDYVEGVPHEFWKEAISELKGKNSEFFMLAETSQPSFYEDGFDMIYDWNFSGTLSNAFTGKSAVGVISKSEDMLSKVADGKGLLRYVFNHDVAAENDVAKMYGSAEGRIAAYVAATMLNGTPLIYSSMDVEGESGKQSFFTYGAKTFSDKLSKEYKKINEAFKKTASVRGGQLSDHTTSDVICFTRRSGSNTLLVMVNTTGGNVDFRTPISLSGEEMEDVIKGEKVKVPLVESLEAYGYSIYMK